MAQPQQVSGRVTTPSPAAGFAVWLTGLPASGKTTLALTLQRRLAARNIHTLVMDSDELRRILTPSPTYSDTERDWFYGALAQLAAWLTRNGVNVLIAATANRRAYRQAARDRIERFAEVYVRCSPATCRQRDRKGLYAGADAGRAEQLPGLGSPYEPPLQPELLVDTEQYQPAEAAAFVLARLATLSSITSSL